MPFRYVDNLAIADSAFEAWGVSVEEMFISSSEALLGIMLENHESLTPQIVKKITIEAETHEMLLFRMLNEIVYLKDAESSFYIVSEVVLREKGNLFVIEIVLSGERIDTSKHNTIVDVKAVTMHEFSISEMDGVWKAFAVVDI